MAAAYSAILLTCPDKKECFNKRAFDLVGEKVLWYSTLSPEYMYIKPSEVFL